MDYLLAAIAAGCLGSGLVLAFFAVLAIARASAPTENPGPGGYEGDVDDLPPPSGPEAG